MMSQTALAAGSPTRVAGRSFYLYMSLACALTAFAGFAPTYFFRAFSDLPPLSPLAQIHGAVFSAWMLLFVAQAALVRVDRRDLHRYFGVVGAVLAVLMLWVGTAAALGVVVRFEATGFRPHGLAPTAFLSTQLGMLLQFAVFVALAIGLRRHAEAHKRLLLLATISILPPAVARFHLENHGIGGAYTSTLLAYLFVVVAASYDFVRMRRVHLVYVWGGLAMIAWMLMRSAIGKTDAWQPIARGLLPS
jgi:hypothetical protein